MWLDHCSGKLRVKGIVSKLLFRTMWSRQCCLLVLVLAALRELKSKTQSHVDRAQLCKMGWDQK